MAIWFTSDTHFNHAKVINYSSRPFTNLNEMTDAMVTNWNTVVKTGDTIYHLGDFALSRGQKHTELIDNLLLALNGQKWLIVGNHDRDEVVKNKRWVAVKDYHEIKLDLGGLHKQRIVMCHYALRVWNQMNRGAWMLHGHSHGNLIDTGGRMMDVGVDCHNHRPISLEEVALFMASRTPVQYDHH